MPSPFDAAMAVADATIAATFGGSVRIVPAVVSDFGVAADPSRAPVVIEAVFTSVPVQERLEGKRRGGGYEGFTTLGGAGIYLWVRAAVAATLPYEPQKGDRVERGGATYSVSGPPQRTDLGDFPLPLVVETNP